MPNDVVIRAWKDKMFRDSLTDAQRAMLPPNPAGLVELSDEDLGLLEVDAGSGCLCVTTIVTVITVSVSATASCVNC